MIKVTTATRTISLLLIIVILLSGCASTTLFTTSPIGATVYVEGEKMGTTPYKYSDTKIAFSSTPITFKKNGYKDLNIILKRSEQPALAAILGGLLVYVPLLWVTEYKKSHFYELDKTDTPDQDIKAISELNINSVSKPDSALIINQVERPVTDTIIAANLKELTDTSSLAQVSPGTDFTKRTISQFGTGLGLCLKGGFIGLNYTFIGSKRWGVSLSYNANPFKPSDVPSDYDRVFIPRNYVNVISINLLKAFPVSKSNSRFSIESGPSWVSFSKGEIVLNPNYDPNYGDPNYDDTSWFWRLWNGSGTKYKYNKSHSAKSTIGASIMAKMEFLYAPYGSLGLALFTNINNLRTIAGFGLYVNFGDVRD
jgi:uncharacterized protein YceK